MTGAALMNKIRSAFGLAAGVIVLVVVPTFGLTAVASAASDETAGSVPEREVGGPERRGPRPQLTDEQRQCLADQGVTPPERSADGTRARPTDEQRAAHAAAAEACGLPARRGPGPRPQLTDEQRQCLADQGVTRPERSADGTRVRPTEEQRAAFAAAAEACGLPAPPPGPTSGPAAIGS
jgi:hypothetical protein